MLFLAAVNADAGSTSRNRENTAFRAWISPVMPPNYGRAVADIVTFRVVVVSCSNGVTFAHATS
jgi:hypothetical protein